MTSIRAILRVLNSQGEYKGKYSEKAQEHKNWFTADLDHTHFYTKFSFLRMKHSSGGENHEGNADENVI